MRRAVGQRAVVAGAASIPDAGATVLAAIPAGAITAATPAAAITAATPAAAIATATIAVVAIPAAAVRSVR